MMCTEWILSFIALLDARYGFQCMITVLASAAEANDERFMKCVRNPEIRGKMNQLSQKAHADRFLL